MFFRNAVASTVIDKRGPSSASSSFRSSRTVVCARQFEARSAAKSCFPTSCGAAARIAATSSGRRTSQACPRESGARTAVWRME